MRPYSFKDITVLINSIEIQEWDAGDDVLQVAYSVNSMDHVVGADGFMVPYVQADNSGIFTMRLQQTSPSNALLSAIVAAQNSGLFVPTTVLWKDNGGVDLGSGTKGYVQKTADVTRGTAHNGQTWVVIVERLDQLLGGAPLA